MNDKMMQRDKTTWQTDDFVKKASKENRDTVLDQLMEQ